MAGALAQLLSNSGGPETSCRKLYRGVLRSMASYGTPFWAQPLSAPNKRKLYAMQRTITLRVIRGYRTISAAAACLLAGTPPWEFEAGALATVYNYTAVKKHRGEAI